MGALNGGSKDKPGVKIILSNPSIIAGEPISGSVNFILPISLNGLLVQFKLIGSEFTKFTENKNINEGKVKVLNYSSTLYTSFNNFVKSGSYSLPFTIQTPPQIPGSFESKTREYQGRIRYSIKVELWERSNLLIKDKTPFFVKQAINAQRESLLANYTRAILCCGCFTKGECTINCHLDRNAYLPGEIALVSITVDNTRSSVWMKKVRVRLVQILSLSADNHVSITRRKAMFSKNLKVLVVGGDRLMSEKSLEVAIPLKFKKTDLGMCGTTQGRIIQCNYQVEVSSFLGYFMTQGPGVDIPILIYPKEIALPEPTAPPIEWNPVDLPPMSMNAWEEQKNNTGYYNHGPPG